jgi:hypothetical protein
MNADERELFEGLQSLSDSAFPKTCKNCGKVYHSPADFFTGSSPINDRTGLKSSLDDDDRSIVEVFRNCECGSTLMDFFEDRRDTTAKGLKRRALFGRMLELLQQRGLTADEARQELIGLMNGRASEKIEALGIRLSAAPPSDR